MLLNTKNKSLYFKLGIYFFIIISIIIVIQSTFNYFITKKQLEDNIKNDIKVSSLQLKNSVITFMESYQVTEYEKLIKHEMNHNNLLAITIEDYLTGKIIGKKSYETGIYRNNNAELIFLDSINSNIIKQIKKNKFIEEINLINSDNEQIGKLSIYGRDSVIKNELNNIIVKNLLISFLIYSIISFVFYILIKTILIKPIQNIINSLSYTDNNEIIFNKIKEDSSKEFTFLSNSINNMTKEIKNSHKKLKENELRWQFAVDGRGDGLWDWNVKTSEVYFSTKWKAMLGFKEDEIEGSLKEWKNRVHPDDLKQVYLDIQNHMYGKTNIYSNEHRVKCKDNTYKWIHDRGIVVERDKKGNPIRLIGTHSDISERKENEFKMKKALIVYENTNEGIMVTDSNNQIIDVNPSFSETTGYSLVEVFGKNPSILKSHMKDDTFYKNMWNKLKKQGSWQGEITNKKKNGELYEEYLSINTIKNSDGIVNNYIGIFSDISTLKQQEKMIVQQARTSAIGEMIGNIAHQWRQPLSYISTAATGMKLQLEMDMPITKESTIETFNKINEQAQHLSGTIEDFRNFFSENLSEIVEFEISEVVEKVSELTKDTFLNNFVQVNTNIEKGIYLESNKNLLIQALLNIYNNALDALKEINGTRAFFVFVKKEDSNIIIRIRDNAGGVPLELIEKIFDPYFTTKHKSQGTGIGLYMTQQIVVKQLEGNIDVNNINFEYKGKKYTGAEFSIKLK